MKISIKPSRAKGRINAPPSKSMAHRLLICAAMSEGVSRVRGISTCEDVLATLDCLAALGISTERDGDTVTVYGRDFRDITPKDALRCRESGSTLRFMIPLAMLSGKTTVFYGESGLMRRPMGVYEKLFRALSLTYISDGESIVVKGPIKGGDYEVEGGVSSQFISGLLFALPIAEGDSRIRIAPPIESRSYIELTLSALRLFGIEANWENEHTVFIRGGQRYAARDITVEGDYSGAAFPAALSLLGGEVTVDGLNPDSIQGDKAYGRFYDMLSSGIPTIHIGDCPDLGPVLFAVAAAKFGGIFDGTRRLKIKESDRATAMAEELSKFGTTVRVYDDTVVIYPTAFHAPSETLNGHGDHRIVMALAVLLTLTGGEIDGAEAVAKSYPDFFEDLAALGVKVESREA